MNGKFYDTWTGWVDSDIDAVWWRAEMGVELSATTCCTCSLYSQGTLIASLLLYSWLVDAHWLLNDIKGGTKITSSTLLNQT